MALNKLENVNPLPWRKNARKKRDEEKKDQECGRDLANFYFVCVVRMLSESLNAHVNRFGDGGFFPFHFTAKSVVVVFFFHLAIFFLSFCQSRVFDDTKHLIICYVTVLRARIFEWHKS